LKFLTDFNHKEIRHPHSAAEFIGKTPLAGKVIGAAQAVEQAVANLRSEVDTFLRKAAA
jgi:hypothetical protein